MSKDMRCPFCHKKLTEGNKKKFENLCDHVSDPNQENYPERPTYVCDCETSKGGFWDGHGDFYCSEYKDEYCGCHTTDALNSFSRRCNIAVNFEIKHSKKWWFKFIEGILFKWEFAR